MRHAWALTLSALVAFLVPRTAQAQHDYWEFNLHAGAFAYDLGIDDDDDEDNTDTDVLFGARLAKHWESGFGIGLNGDWILADQFPAPVEGGTEDIDINLYLWSLGLDYTFPSAGITSPRRRAITSSSGRPECGSGSSNRRASSAGRRGVETGPSPERVSAK